MRKRLLSVLMAIVTVSSLVILMTAPVMAGPGVPPGANSNDLSLQLSVVPNLTINGATVGYYISISNPINPTPTLITAKAIGIVVKFYPPGANGLPIAAPTYTSASFDMDPGAAPVSMPVQDVVLALNPGVVNAVGRATFDATLLTYPVDSQVSGDKNIPLTIMVPGTIAGISASVSEVPAGGGDVVLTITDFNSGTAPLTSPSVVLSSSPGVPTLPQTLTKASSAYKSGDTDGDGVLGIGETWKWEVTVNVTQNTTFTMVGHGFDSTGVDVTDPAFPLEKAQVSVIVRHETPAINTLGIGLMIGGFVAAIAFFVVRKVRRSPLAG
jgi:hypothetical protein